MPVVSLGRVVDAIESLFEGHSVYLNPRTGEIVTCSHDELRAAEEEPSDGESVHQPDWKRTLMEEAKRVLSDGDFLELPGAFDIHEYDIMWNFCSVLEDEELRDELLSLLHGRGAFRRFKDAIDRYGMTDRWYQCRAEAIEEIAREWLETNGVPFGP